MLELLPRPHSYDEFPIAGSKEACQAQPAEEGTLEEAPERQSVACRQSTAENGHSKAGPRHETRSGEGRTARDKETSKLHSTAPAKTSVSKVGCRAGRSLVDTRFRGVLRYVDQSGLGDLGCSNVRVWST